jgi:DNA primase
MSERKKVKILKEVLGSPFNSGRESLFYCPKCKHHKKKMSVNLSKNKFKCWVCDYSGNDVTHLVRRYGTKQQKEEWYEVCDIIDHSDLELRLNEILSETPDTKPDKQKIDLPEEFYTLTSRKLPESTMPAISYLRRRDIERNDVVTWKIGHCTSGLFKDRIIIPSFDVDGDVNYFIARSYSKTAFPKYKNPNVPKNIIFNELFLDFTKDLILVEGVFDAINAGGNVVPILGSTLDEKHPLFQKIIENQTEVYLALDHDARKKETKIAKLLNSYDISVYKIDTTGYQDVGVMPRDVYAYRKARASLFTETTLLNHRYT